MTVAASSGHYGERLVSLIEKPFPYQSMLAICSDLDETLSSSVYFNTAEFLNSRRNTKFGQGVGLEVGNTIFFDMAPGEFSYWSASDRDRSLARQLMKSGHIDAIHSFGDRVDNRADVEKILDHLDANGCHLNVWIDHAVAPSNFGSDIMQGRGDIPGDACYHADISLDYGIKFVWRGRVSSQAGQDAPKSIGGIVNSGSLLKSSVTALKEAAKVVLADCGDEKYAMHSGNRLVRHALLRDGQQVVEFMRCNPHPYGISVGDNAEGLGDVLSERFLRALSRRKANAIVYTHLGKRIDPNFGFPAKTVAALERLSDYQSRGDILVTTTSRLLRYVRNRDALKWSYKTTSDEIQIEIVADPDKDDLQGVGFKIPSESPCSVYQKGQRVECKRFGFPEEQYSVIMIPWERLQFPGIEV